ncbi:hypothetical protein EDC04DRAFT_2101500 [Pisolithus marmoratus]|nr:hypothetical protein EDC04DRAFT_2101500 [Pisolithus marmoratus]
MDTCINWQRSGGMTCSTVTPKKWHRYGEGICNGRSHHLTDSRNTLPVHNPEHFFNDSGLRVTTTSLTIMLTFLALAYTERYLLPFSICPGLWVAPTDARVVHCRLRGISDRREVVSNRAGYHYGHAQLPDDRVMGSRPQRFVLDRLAVTRRYVVHRSLR